MYHMDAQESIGTKREGKQAVVTMEEGKRIFSEYHGSGIGGHFGITKTMQWI